MKHLIAIRLPAILPFAFALPTSAQLFDGGEFFSAAICSDSMVHVWGDNQEGQLGNGTFTSSAVPLPLGVAHAVALTAEDKGLYVLTDQGQIWVCGRNNFGQMGLGSTAENIITPTLVEGIDSVIDVQGAGGWVMALRSNGTVWGWGVNNTGQAGTGTNEWPYEYSTPQQAIGLTDVIAIASGDYHGLALRADGSLWAWGENSQGQLGNGTTTDSLIPSPTSPIPDVIALAAGHTHNLALTATGEVWAWGHNGSGQLGIGSSMAQLVPVQVPGINDVVAIAAGENHSLALRSDGTVWGWGRNVEYEVGNYLATIIYTPVPVIGIEEVSAIEAGEWFSLALKNDGTLWGWGENLYGALGNGQSGPDEPDPGQVLDLCAMPLALRPAATSEPWHAFPNPTHGPITIDHGSGTGDFVVSNALGQPIVRGVILNTPYSIDLSSHPNGVYTVSTVIKGVRHVQRVIKQ